MSTSTDGSIPDSSDENGRELRIFMAAMITFPTIAVVLRFWSRAIMPPNASQMRNRHFWWDDWAVLVTWVCFSPTHNIYLQTLTGGTRDDPQLLTVMCSIVSCIMVGLGVGKHYSEVGFVGYAKIRKLVYVTFFSFGLGTGFGRASALLFYALIFDMISRTFAYALWVLHALNVAWMVGLVFAVIFQCSPVESAWNPAVKGHCVALWSLWMGILLPALIIDLAILLLPMPILGKLHLPRSRKFLIITLFACGYM
ncbi:hypothetical protein BO70DRAFT_418230 [Aspergillus heteromorphus CBS 117.55]|uniref:Rhodopsin domain-containing protein n=1 Tax=Aspergillus heteromorphus CBS 117.55 TaxID=1448321 RepID=A0A317WSU1_9EURO|nr:uncharacterized protein BO70DRAFT_418230 [Aspergillus heteromorphus CBS 117.55]PWY89165.1 hypothetical protein BO70DRAFT_418230 [Aspergillus heteromorphus CBS 117.55]